MRRAAALAAVALVAGGAGCGDGETGGGALVWDEPPQLFQARNRDSDKVLVGTVRNNSLRPLELTASKLVARDRSGDPIEAYAQFIGGFAHGLFGGNQRPDPLPQEERSRLGYVVSLEPGKTAPLYVALRIPAGAGLPLSVDYGDGVLPVPERVRGTAR